MTQSLTDKEREAMHSDFGLRLSNSMKQYGPLCVGIDPHRGVLENWGYSVDAEGAELFAMRMLQAASGRAMTSAIISAKIFFFIFRSPAAASSWQQTPPR